MDGSPFGPGDLDSGEQVLWIGKPIGPPPLTFGDILLILFTFAFAAMAILILLSAAGLVAIAGGTPAFTVFGTLFCLIGIAVSGGMWVLTRMQWRQTSYAVTDRRIYRVISGRKRQVRHYSRQSIRDVSLKLRSDGSGSIVFNLSGAGAPGNWNNSPRVGYESGGVGFFTIPEARRVEALLDDPARGRAITSDSAISRGFE